MSQRAPLSLPCNPLRASNPTKRRTCLKKNLTARSDRYTVAYMKDRMVRIPKEHMEALRPLVAPATPSAFVRHLVEQYLEARKK